MKMNRSVLPTLLLLLAAPGHAQQRPARPERPQREERVIRVVEAEPRGWLGIRFRGAEAGPGMHVADVSADSPAERAGVHSGDVVVRLDGRPFDAAALERLRPAPGDTVRLRIRREGGERELPVVAGERPARVVIVRTPGRTVTLDMDSLERSVRVRVDTLSRVAEVIAGRLDREAIRLDSGVIRLDSLSKVFRSNDLGRIFRDIKFDTAAFRDVPEALRFGFFAGQRALAGAEWSEINPELGSYFGTERGVLVLRVTANSPAARAGLRAGDVVVRAGNEQVGTVAALRRAVARADDDQLRLGIVRERQPRELRLRWEGEGAER